MPSTPPPHPKASAEQKDTPTGPDPDVVEWSGEHDEETPRNWTFTRKMQQSCLWAVMVFVPSLGGGIYSSSVGAVSERFGISEEVANLGTSLFLLGSGFGPVIFGPLSEYSGRKLPATASLALSSVFSIGAAAALSTSGLMLCRFFAGVFGIAPASCVSGGLADMWDTRERGVVLTCILGLFFVGSSVTPVFGSLIVASAGGWRWTLYATAILGFVVSAVAQALMRETYAPVLLSRREARIRFETKDWAVRAKSDEVPPNLASIVNTYFVRPPVLLTTEPKLAFLTVYTSLIWGLLFLYLETIPIAFHDVRGWSTIIATLPFISEAIGILIGAGIIITQILRPRKNNPHSASADRLPIMILGGVLLPIGLFWFAWTSNPNISWVPQVISIAVIAIWLFVIYVQSLNYIVDCYPSVANSAIAANTSVRAIFGAAFPMIALPFYGRLGVPWATSLLGFLCAAMVPLPVWFAYQQRKQIREKQKHEDEYVG